MTSLWKRGSFFALILIAQAFVRDSQGQATFSNLGAITVPATGSGASTGAVASPYASTISVTGTGGTVTKATVTLNNITHTFTADMDVLLVSPGGAKITLLSDVGGSSGVTNVTLTFDDTVAASLPS